VVRNLLERAARRKCRAPKPPDAGETLETFRCRDPEVYAVEVCWSA
jgi:hypothetical protein